MHIDGFRFDLASISRAVNPGKSPKPARPVGHRVGSRLSGTKLIAKPGTLPAFIKSAVLLATVGKNGTDVFA